ncbi:MAG: DUF6261 family protein [Bacteroidia bacterium]|nr:DUF6261 family protein [Bacteroidia bacterium]
MKINHRDLTRLSRWEVFQLFADAIAFAVAAKEGKSELYVTVLSFLQNKFNVFDDALVQEKATSSLLPDAEEGRDYGVRKMFSIATEYADFRVDETKETAADIVLATFKPYGNGRDIARMAQDAETGVLTNLLQDLEKEAVKTAVETLGLTSLVTYIKTNNQEFEKEKLSQTEEKARFVAGAVKTARTETQEAFKKFCETVNALIIVEGAEKYETLVPQLNTRIKDGIDTANQRLERTRAEKKKKEEAAAAAAAAEAPETPETPSEMM